MNGRVIRFLPLGTTINVGGYDPDSADVGSRLPI